MAGAIARTGEAILGRTVVLSALPAWAGTVAATLLNMSGRACLLYAYVVVVAMDWRQWISGMAGCGCGDAEAVMVTEKEMAFGSLKGEFSELAP